jgi:hypothetical protein
MLGSGYSVLGKREKRKEERLKTRYQVLSKKEKIKIIGDRF